MKESLTYSALIMAALGLALNALAFMLARRGAATGTRRGLWRRLKGLLTRQAQAAGCGSKDARGDSRPWIPPGWSFPRVTMLAEPFAGLFDFGELEREARQARQELTGPQKPLREPRGLREYLKPDVTRTEELLLTEELSRLGPCFVERPARCRSDRREAASQPFLVELTALGFEVAFS